MQGRFTSLRWLCVVLVASACGQAVPLSCPQPTAGDIVYVVGSGWHTEIGIPVEELGNDLAFYRAVFPAARVILFGYGKKTFFIAPAETMREYMLGPFPGPAAIQAIGLSVIPLDTYPADSVVTLALPPGGSAALSKFIGNDLARDLSGQPRVVARSADPDGLFYAANSEYTLLHTCNTWIIDALLHAGLPVSADYVMFTGQAMRQVRNVAEERCQ